MNYLDAQHKIMSEEIWLKYYNNFLFEKKIITVEQRDKMILAIENSCNTKRKQHNIKK